MKIGFKTVELPARTPLTSTAGSTAAREVGLGSVPQAGRGAGGSEKGAATDTLTLRLSIADRELLDRLVAQRAAELEDLGAKVTAASFTRWLIRREAKAKGLL